MKAHKPPAIHTVESLREHLQWALELEHSTIPPYLCALYSLPDRQNLAAQDALRAVVMEEMLHMVLVANVLNAVGGAPQVDDPDFVPRYPTTLPHSNGRIEVHLRRFSPEALAIFLAIEHPEPPGAQPQAEGYATIGQFYDAIEAGLRYLAGQLGEVALFSGQAQRQIDATHWYYGSGGKPVVVSNLASSLKALDEIKTQGEGLPHSIFDETSRYRPAQELAHYFRFEELRLGRRYQAQDTPASGPTGPLLPVDWQAVHPMRANPQAADYARDPERHAAMQAFNRGYSQLLRQLHQAFNGLPAQLFEAVPLMYQLRYQAQSLMKVPCSDDGPETMGPSFEFLR